MKNTGFLNDANKEVSLDVNIRKFKYILINRHQNAGQNRNISIVNRTFENFAMFKYL
jgi:hypothetical protein